MMNAKKWNIVVIGTLAALLVLTAGVTIFIDPFFHYRAGQDFLEYPLKEERYQNDGIARHYAYDSIITGTSMCQNFKCSEFDELWGAASIKIANSGAGFHETCENMERALSHNRNVKYILCSIDGNLLNRPASQDEYDGYPTYLYDDNPFNDVNYLLNKEVVTKTVAVLNYTKAGETTTTMDEYGSWNRWASFGKEHVLSSFSLQDERDEETELSEEDLLQIRENIGDNWVKLAKTHPDVTFYLFFPPYSVCYWEALSRTKQLNAQTEAQKTTAALLTDLENVQVYDFSDRTDITGNLDNYTDTLHYGEWINSEILRMIAGGEGRVTEENVEAYYDAIRKIYEEYDYTQYRE